MAKLEELGAQVGDQIILEGKVAFSEVAQRVEGERLERKIKRQESQGFKYPTTDPHYSLSLVDVGIGADFQGTPLAQYYGEKVYENKDGKLALTLETKSKFPPRFYHEQEDGTAVEIEELPAELGVGQEVKVLIKTFGSKKFSNMGSSFDAVLIAPGEINYYSNNAASEIEAFGLKPAEGAPKAETTSVSDGDNPFGASANDTEETEESAVADVPEDAKPDEPSGGAVDNPFA